MGSVFRPKDLGNGYNKVIDNSLKDLHPDIKNDIYKLLKELKSPLSKEKLMRIIGPEKLEKLLNQKDTDNLDDTEKEDLKNIFKDSITFD